MYIVSFEQRRFSSQPANSSHSSLFAQDALCFEPLRSQFLSSSSCPLIANGVFRGDDDRHVLCSVQLDMVFYLGYLRVSVAL